MFRKNQNSRENKSGISAEVARAKRVGQFSQLRRADREQQLSRRRENNSPDAPENAQQQTDIQIMKDVCYFFYIFFIFYFLHFNHLLTFITLLLAFYSLVRFL